MPGAFSELRAELTLDSEGVSRGVSDAERSISGLKTAIGGLGVAAGAAAAGGLAASVSAASDFESQMVELEKVTDPKTAEEMGSAIQDMAGEMALSQGALAGVAEQAGRLGIEGTDNISEFTRVVGEMSVATDLTADEAADSFARMTTLMNEPVENVRTLGDSVNALSNSMATSSSEITNAATRSAGALTNMGMASEDVLALNAAMNEVSPSARVAGTQLRRMSQELMDPGKVSDIAGALGMNVDEFKAMRSNDPTGLIQRMAQEMSEGGEEAEALRGTLSATSRQALAGLSNNLEGMNSALETSSEQFKEGGSLAAEFETAMGTFKNQVQLARNTLTNIAITIGNVLLPHLTTLMEYVTGALQRFQDFNEATNGVAATIGLVTTAITGLVGGGALLLSQMGMLGPAITGVKIALSALLGPIGLVGAAVTAFAAGFASDFGGIRTQTMRVVSAFRDTFVPIFRQAKATILPIINQIGEAFDTQGGRIESVAGSLATMLGDRLLGHIQTLGAITQRVMARVGALWNTHGEGILSMINLISTNLSEGLISAMAAVMAALEGDWVQMRAMFQQGGQAILNIWNAIWPQVRAAATAAFDYLTETLPSKLAAAFNAVVAWVHSTGIPMAQQAFRTLTSQALTALEFTRENIVPRVRSGLNSAWNWVRTEGVALAMGALSFLSTQALGALEFTREKVVPPVRSGLQTAWNWIRTEGVTLAKEALSFLATQALAALEFTRENIVPKVRAGLAQAWTWVRTEGVTLAKQALSFLATQALAALEFTRENIVPPVRTGLEQAWTWVRTEGVALAKSAFSSLVSLTMNAVDFWNGAIQPRLAAAFDSAKTWIMGPALERFKSAFRTLGANWYPMVLDTLGLILEAFQTVIPMVTSWLSENGPGLINKAFKAIGTGIRRTILGMFAVAGTVGQAVVSAMNGVRDWLQDGGKERLKNGFINIITGIVSYLKNDAWDDLKAAAKFLFDAVMAAAEGLYEGLIGGSLFPEMFQDIISYIKNVDMQGAFYEILNAAYLWVRDTAVPQFIGAIEGMLSDIISAITSTDVQAAFYGILNDAYLWIKNTAIPDFLSAGKGLVDAMVDGIKDSPGAIKNAVEDIVGDARDLLPWSDAKEGPFSDLTGSGAAIPETIAKGARKNLGALTDVLGELPSPGPDSQPSPGSTATPATTGASSGGDNVEVHFDFGDLDDDDYISVGALKAMIKEEIRDDNDRKIRRGSL